MTTENMTKDELQNWKLVQARINDSGELDDDAKAAAAAVHKRAESRRRVTELLDAKPDTFVLTFQTPIDKESDETARIRESKDERRFSIAKHVDEKQPPGRAAGALMILTATA